MMKTKRVTEDYRSPECTVIEVTVEGMLCGSIGMTTEDMGGLEDVLGGEQ